MLTKVDIVTPHEKVLELMIPDWFKTILGIKEMFPSAISHKGVKLHKLKLICFDNILRTVDKMKMITYSRSWGQRS